MKSIVILSANYRVRMLYLFMLSSGLIDYILADSGEHESAALHLFPGAIKRSSAYVTGCHCNCTSNNNDDLSNIGFFPCQSFGCIQCAPTNYDVCVSAYTDNEGNEQYGMYVCLTEQQTPAMCLYNLQIPYFTCDQADNRYIECQYEQGNKESFCTFRAPTTTIADGCYPLAPACPDSSRVCCETAKDCSCLSDILPPSSDICLQKSMANSLWGSCKCDTHTHSGSPVCGACGECDDDDRSPDGTNTVSGSNPKGGDGGGDIGGFDESHQDPVKIAGVVVPIVAIVIFVVVGVIVVWRSGGIPKCMRRRCVCTCEETGSMTELPVKRSSRGPDQENPYEIETNDEPHFYAGVHNIDSKSRSEPDGPLTNAQEDTNGYLWYRGEGSSNMSKKEPTNLDQNKKDPGDGLVYYELEEPKEKVDNQPVTDPTPDYLEFDVDNKPESTGEETQPPETVKSLEHQQESHSNPVVDVADEDSQYGKLDRSPNKSGHLKSQQDPLENDQYGHLEPIKNDADATPGCPAAAETYQSLDRSRVLPVDENKNAQSGGEYGQLDVAEAKQHTSPSSVAPLPESTSDLTRTRTPDDMPPSSEEVYGVL